VGWELTLKLFLSYEVGFIKPETGTYQKILDQTGLTADQCLFLGATFAADYEGPSKYGFQALHLIREALTTDCVIGNLTEVIKIFEAQ
jgi:FMN phosphatase YigB (HAD superfamily)